MRRQFAATQQSRAGGAQIIDKPHGGVWGGVRPPHFKWLFTERCGIPPSSVTLRVPASPPPGGSLRNLAFPLRGRWQPGGLTDEVRQARQARAGIRRIRPALPAPRLAWVPVRIRKFMCAVREFSRSSFSLKNRSFSTNLMPPAYPAGGPVSRSGTSPAPGRSCCSRWRCA